MAGPCVAPRLTERESVEEEAVTFKEVNEFQLEWVGQLCARKNSCPSAGDDERRNREAELTEQACMHDIGIESGTALEKHGLETGSMQMVEDEADVDTLLSGHDDLRDILARETSPVVISRCEDDWARVCFSEEGRGPVEICRPRHHGNGRSDRLPAFSTLLAEIVVEPHRAVPLGANGACTDQDHVRQRPKGLEYSVIGGATEGSGASVDADRAVQGRNHVAANEGPVNPDIW